MAMRKRDEVFPNAAAVDVGASSHWAAVPQDRTDQPVREAGVMTDDLHTLADWLIECGVDTVALEFERHGLSVVPHARTESALDPETLWRIPPDINVAPFPVPIRKMRAQDLKVLTNRQAGNRGKAKVRKTTPFSG